MIERFSSGKLFWINLKNPIAEELHVVMEECDMPPALMGDLLTPVPRNYAVEAEGVIKLAIDFPVVKRIDAEHPYEVKFMFSKKALVTVQYEEMEGLDRFKKGFEVLVTLNKTKKRLTGGDLFFALMSELYATSSSKLDYVESKLADIEAEIFKDNERLMVVEIAKTSKRLISYRHVLRAHEDMFFEAEPLFALLYSETHQDELAALQKTYSILYHRTNALFDTLNALREANFAMLTAKQNETMKIFTIMAFVTFPLSLLTSTFGMNTQYTPIVGHLFDFWIIVGIMIAATGCFFVFFRYKRWI
jgi:magnesium transporter